MKEKHVMNQMGMLGQIQENYIQQQNTITHMPANTSKRGWTPEEDQILQELLSASAEDKHKWVQASKELFARTGRQRSGKQCRERWQHQLNPAIVRDEWTQSEILSLFEIHLKFGNRWAKIAAKLPGRTDNGVKNFFYSSVRRVLTKINGYLAKQRHRKEFKNIRQFQSQYLSKLMSVVDGQYEKRLRLTGPDAFHLAKGMFEFIADVLNQISYLIIHGIDENVQGVDQKLDQKILKMHEFRKNCKKRKKINNYNAEEGQAQQSNEANSPPKDSILSSSQSSQSSLSQVLKIEEKQEKPNTGSHDKKQLQIMCLSQPIEKKEVTKIQEQLWNIFTVHFKMQESHCEQKYKEQSDIYSLPFAFREEQMGVGRIMNEGEVVTKFKMLEVSMALDQCLLKAKQSKCFGNINKPESDL